MEPTEILEIILNRIIRKTYDSVVKTPPKSSSKISVQRSYWFDLSKWNYRLQDSTLMALKPWNLLSNLGLDYLALDNGLAWVWRDFGAGFERAINRVISNGKYHFIKDKTFTLLTFVSFFEFLIQSTRNLANVFFTYRLISSKSSIFKNFLKFGKSLELVKTRLYCSKFGFRMPVLPLFC